MEGLGGSRHEHNQLTHYRTLSFLDLPVTVTRSLNLKGHLKPVSSVRQQRWPLRLQRCWPGFHQVGPSARPAGTQVTPRRRLSDASSIDPGGRPG